jgi:uncharacterized protein with HEPN domain
MRSKERRETRWLEDIRERIVLIDEFVGGRDAGALDADPKSLFAVKAALTEISEAVRRLGRETTDRYPDIDWRSARDLRNVYTHEYHRVDTSLLVNTVRARLPGLKRAVEAELRRRRKAKGKGIRG